MSMKIMSLALATAALVAFPAAASAQEAHVTGISTFNASGGAGTIVASGEPTVSFTSISGGGDFDSGSTTTGLHYVSFVGTSTEFFGIKAECHTTGDPEGVVHFLAAFHIITVNNRPGVLLTPTATTLICPGFSNRKIGGDLIGTITSPACGGSSKTFTVVFKASGSTQEHTSYTGSNYDLTAQTGSGSKVTTGLTSTTTFSSSTSGTLECT